MRAFGTAIIAGQTAVCQGSSITLTYEGGPGTTVGSWVASPSPDVMITPGPGNTATIMGVTGGTTVTISCTGTGGPASITITIGVPTGTIVWPTGSTNGPGLHPVHVCQTPNPTTYIQLTCTPSGGIWGTNSGPEGMGITSGQFTTGTANTTLIETISYSLNGCVTTDTVHVDDFPRTLNPTTVCVGSSITLTDWPFNSTTTIGTFSNTDGLIALDSSYVTSTNHVNMLTKGLIPGTSSVYFTLPDGCVDTGKVTVKVSPVITGTLSICDSGSVTILTDTGGAAVSWLSSNTSLATVTSTGHVISHYSDSHTRDTTVTITATYSGNLCPASVVVTLYPKPKIIGGHSVCLGSTLALTGTPIGGTWSSNQPLIASVSTSGVVTGLAYGTAIITYQVASGCSAMDTVSVNPDSIRGYTHVCVGLTDTLTNSAGAGTWTSSDTTIAKINSSGIITGISAGSVVISYVHGSTSCATSIILVVNPLPGAITGNMPVCVGSTMVLADTSAGGNWTANNGNATINPTSGLVTGIAAGTDKITYTLPTGCLKTAVVVINPLPATISGGSSVCVGSSITLGETTGGGIWSSSSSHASVDTSGNVTGLSVGTATITYKITATGCYVTKVINVLPLPNAGTITGTSTACVGSTTNLVDTASGGTWSSSDTTIAKVSGGVVTGIGAGTAVISYTVTNSCGTAVATDVVTILPLPNAGTITGTSTACVGSTTNLVDTVSGGSWSSSDTTIAKVSGGVVTGIGAGTAVISYTVTNSCGTAVATDVVTILPLPDAGTITGTSTACVGDTLTLVDATAGGVWSSSDITVATVTGGIVIGVGTGTAVISYTVTNSCGTAVATDTVTIGTGGSAGTITGTAPLCIGLTITLGDVVTGGAWTSSDITVATVSGGVVTGIGAGTAIISYTVTSGCGTGVATDTITVSSCCLTDTLVINTGYNPLTGSTVPVGSNGHTPSPDPRWNVYAISTDAATAISFAGNTAVAIDSSADVIDGTTVVGGGSPDTGWVAGVNSQWISCQNDVKYRTYDTASYTMVLGRPFTLCSDDTITFDLNIAVDNYIDTGSIYIDDISHPLSFGEIRAALPTYIQYFGSFTHFTQSVALTSGEHILYFLVENYSRYHGAPNPTGLNVYGDIYSADGIASIVRENDTSCHSSCGGERHFAPSATPAIVPVTENLVCFPNPNGGSFTLRGALSGTATSKEAKIELVDMVGKVVYRDVAVIENGGINKTITVGDNIANGVYLIKVISGNSSNVLRVSVQR